MTNATQYKLRPGNVSVQGVPQTAATVQDFGDALRNYIEERLSASYHAEMPAEEAQHSLIKRSMAFTLLSIMERVPYAETVFALSRNSYDNPISFKLNTVTVPDRYHDLVKEVIDEELIQLTQNLGLMEVDMREQIAEQQACIDRLLDLLKALGVKVKHNYVDLLMQ